VLAFGKLSLVVTKHKEFQVADERSHPARETARLASQAFQVMTQISIDCFDRIGFQFVRSHFIRCAIVQRVVRWKRIAIVLPSLGSSLQTGLQRFARSLIDRIPTQDTVRFPIHHRQNVDFVFLCPRYVNNSSSSATLGLFGMGAFGSFSVYRLTQFTTLCGLTFKIRAIAQ
jgi:hypothetical protein